jgi:hypothetical protein
MNLSGEIGPRTGCCQRTSASKPQNLLAGGADDRLVGDRQLAALERLAQVVLEHLPVARFAVHRRLVEAVLAAPGALAA